MLTLAKQVEMLSPDDFESLVFHTLRRRFPGAGITKVNGSGGDKGIDTFAGRLSDGPAIWQAKAFSRLGKSQKKKIVSSFKNALSFQPSSWTLCVPIDLRTVEHEWFQKTLVVPNAGEISCNLMQGSNFVEYLSLDPELRNLFFPNEILSNAVSLRDSAIGGLNLSLEQKQQLSVATVKSYFDEYRKLDARFEPFAIIGNRKDRTLPAMPGSVFQVRDGDVQVDFVPENQIEYAADPIKIKFSLCEEVSAQLSDALDFGRPTKLPAGSIFQLRSSSALVEYLLGSVDPTTAQLELTPLVPENRQLSLRVVAGDKRKQIAFDQLPFRLVREGRKELEFKYTGPLPLGISLLVPTIPTEAVTVNLALNAEGALIVPYAQAVWFFELLESGKCLSVYDCDSGQLMLSGDGAFAGALKLTKADKQLLRDVALIAMTFNAPIRVPDVITRSDLKAVETLLTVVTGNPFGEGGTITSNLTKDSSIPGQEKFFCGDEPTALTLFALSKFRDIELFGTHVDCGKVAVVVDSIQLLFPKETCANYLKAEEGDVIDWKATCLTPIRLLRNFEQKDAEGGVFMSVEDRTETNSKQNA